MLFGNPDLSDQDNQIIVDAVHSFIRGRDVFNIDVFVVIVIFFFFFVVVVGFVLPPYTVCYCPFSKFCVMCSRIPTDEESF